MNIKAFLIGVVVLPVLLIAAESADIFGNWIAQSSNGWPPGETIFSFTPKGRKLTGTVSYPQGETVIRDGRINGDEISFFVIHTFWGSERKLMYKGTVSLNEIKFTVEEQEGQQPSEFTAKREFQRNQDIPLRFQSKPVRFDSEPETIRIPRR